MKPRVTFDNFQTVSIDDYHLDFADIWARDTIERSVFDLWLHVVDHASRIARAIRRQEPPEVIDDIADTTVWLMSFIAQCQNTKASSPESCFWFNEMPSQIIWQKYPATCPGCYDHWLITLLELKDDDIPLRKLELKRDEILNAINYRASQILQPEPCTCFTRLVTHSREREVSAALRTDFDMFRRFYANRVAVVKRSVESTVQFEAMFHNLYSNAHHILSLESIAFHLLEEVGESSEAIKDLYTFDDSREPYSPELNATRKARFLEEIADVFSWLFTMALKIRSTYVRHAEQYRSSVIPNAIRDRYVGLDFAQSLWSKYGMTKRGANWERLKCPGCQSAPCTCPRDMQILWTSPENQPSTSLKPLISKASDILSERDLIFVSYSHQDRQWLERLQIMIKPLVRNKTISIWDDTRINPGQRWRSEIDSALSRARVAVLLVSPNFLASDFIAQNELPPLLDAAERQGVKVIWIPISACMYKETEIQEYQAAHEPSRPLDSLPEHEQNAALQRVCEYIKSAVQ